MSASAHMDLLLVEDNATDLELTQRVLERNGFAGRFVAMKDGAYAPPNHSDAPKVVFLDLKLPKVSGMEVLRRLKADPRTHNWPVVILTSSQQDRDIAEAYALGANGYIVKPIDFTRFSHVIGEMSRYWLLQNQPPDSHLGA